MSGFGPEQPTEPDATQPLAPPGPAPDQPTGGVTQMLENHGCACLICRVERDLIGILNQQASQAQFRKLAADFPALLIAAEVKSAGAPCRTSDSWHKKQPRRWRGTTAGTLLMQPSMNAFTSPLELVTHLHGQAPNTSRVPTPDETLGVLTRAKAADSVRDVAQGLLILAFAPEAHQPSADVPAIRRRGARHGIKYRA